MSKGTAGENGYARRLVVRMRHRQKPFAAAAGRAASRDPNGRADRPTESGDVRRLELSILRRTHRRHRALNAGSGHGVCAKPAPRANNHQVRSSFAATFTRPTS